MRFQPLNREEVRSVIEGKGRAHRVPILLHQWTYPSAFRRGADRRYVEQLMSEFPQDAQMIPWKNCEIFEPPPDDPEYCWVKGGRSSDDSPSGLDSKIAMESWDNLDELLARFPKSSYANLFPDVPARDGRYRIAHWWYALFERHWSLRGMENALTDFFLFPDQVHMLYRALTDFYRGIIRRAKHVLAADAVYTTDDLGTQNGLFFDHGIFDEFFYPYYSEMIKEAHSLGIHFWLHSCGNIEAIMPDLIRMELDVVHPIQKYCMDEKRIALRYGNDICIWAGFDVQQTIPRGTPEEVRREVRHVFDTYCRPDGLFMFTAGNGITGDTPLRSLRALYEEAFSYGAHKYGATR